MLGILQLRSILQRWKRALHVPLRLDVYYQHSDGQRELLERWCLEYAPSSSNNFAATTNTFTTDPIVQLRQVCKQIVIWLRTLYCWSRMLPAQALRKTTMMNNNSNGASPPIGFSIYVVSEGQDDVSGLVTNQGFLTQGQPHCVPTPYGELGWKVFYAPRETVQRLLPEPSPPYQTTATATTSMSSYHHPKSQPIPMATMQQQQHINNNNNKVVMTE